MEPASTLASGGHPASEKCLTLGGRSRRLHNETGVILLLLVSVYKVPF